VALQIQQSENCFKYGQNKRFIVTMKSIWKQLVADIV